MTMASRKEVRTGFNMPSDIAEFAKGVGSKHNLSMADVLIAMLRSAPSSPILLQMVTESASAKDKKRKRIAKARV
jgi:hypothetical protein